MHHKSGPGRQVHMPAAVSSDEHLRLARIEGQVRGLSRMVQEDRPCLDILVQLLAIKEALSKVGRLVLQHHLERSVTEAIKQDKPEVYTELMVVIEQLGNMR